MADEFVEVRGDAGTVWRFEREFVESNWQCTFGNGCAGILPERTPDLAQGCCSYGAHLGDGAEGRAEALNLSAYASVLEPDQWQNHHVGPEGIFADEHRNRTRIVDGACVFHNDPAFDGGAGCALHRAALERQESPVEWKPSVCWQLPIRVDWEPVDADTEIATVRRWTRADWGEFGATMAWCCTERAEGGEAFSGDQRVIDSLGEEFVELVGRQVTVELRRRLDRTDAD